MEVQETQATYQDNGSLTPLTGRELEILELAGKGLSIKGVAKVLNITGGTVAWHLKNSYQKLRAGGREHALQIARELRLIEHKLVCPVCACSIPGRH